MTAQFDDFLIKQPTVPVRLSDRVEARKAFVRRCLSRGFHDHEILDLCYEHPLFEYPGHVQAPPARGRQGKSRTRTKPRNHRARGAVTADGKRRRLTRAIIKRDYLYVVQREIKATNLDYTEELLKAYQSLEEAKRIAFMQDNAVAVARVQREINRMLGLRRDPDAGGFTPEQVREQLASMFASVEEPPADAPQPKRSRKQAVK